MKQPFQYIFLAVITFMGLTSCEDVVDITPDEADTFLVVDAWLDNTSETQTIRLTNSQPYFDNTFSPAVTGAEVMVTRNGSETLAFTDQGNGNYTWTPENGESIGEVGDVFVLSFIVNGQTYRSETMMNRVPEVDSISQELLEGDIRGPDGIYAEFFARDPEGLGDAYWIKTYKNGQFLNKPEEINIAFDAGFDSGQDIDGIIFIPPVRSLVNPVPDSLSSEEPYWVLGDEIRVEIHSISEAAFNFMEMARNQMINGNSGLFAMPIANSRGNVEAINSDKEVLGVFNVAAIASREKEFE